MVNKILDVPKMLPPGKVILVLDVMSMVVKVLLANHARTDIHGHDNKTPVDLARAAGNKEMMQLFNLN